MRRSPLSLCPQPIGPIPDETARVARAAFPKGNLYLTIRDQIGVLFNDEMFAPLFSPCGQPAETPWRLALVCVMQFIEGLSDRQASEAVRDRLAWKYLLGLELTDPGFHYSVLSEFRDRLIAGTVEQRLLDTLLARCEEQGWLKARGQQRTDSTHVLAAIRTLNRLELVGETLRATLNALAAVAPAWLQALAPAEWFERYSLRVEESRLPKGLEARTAYGAAIGADGMALLTAVYAPDAPVWLREIPAVETLRLLWIQQYVVTDGHVQLRAADDLPPAGARLDSPYEPDARYGNKRTTTWTGYKVHLTETCDADAVHLITHVETTPAQIADADMGRPIHDALVAKDLPPHAHFMDSGYVDAGLVVSSARTHGIEVVGPMRPNSSWQAREGTGYDASAFVVDWERRVVTCPQGRTNSSWAERRDAWGNEHVVAKFSRTDCRLCAARSLCTRQETAARLVQLRPQADRELLHEVRRQQETAEWQARYRRRAGIEGTLSQAIRAYELREARYVGLAKTRLQHILMATGINLVRMAAWLDGTRPAKTRVSHFAALAAA